MTDARMTIPVGLSATFTVTKKGNGAPLIVATKCGYLPVTDWFTQTGCATPQQIADEPDGTDQP